MHNLEQTVAVGSLMNLALPGIQEKTMRSAGDVSDATAVEAKSTGPVASTAKTATEAAINDAGANVKNFDQVSEKMWRSGTLTEENLQELKDAGLKRIFDLRKAGPGVTREAEIADSLGITHIHMPMSIFGATRSYTNQLLDAVTSSDEESLVHCRYGADRTGGFVGKMRVNLHGWSADDAIAEMRDHGFKPFLYWMKRQVANDAKGTAAASKPSIA
jgi:protein tyrosine phosphatase (PTP) superfamily phosphohydrolase (DUF442 family)